MTKKTFSVIRIEKGLGKQRSAFIIDYEGREAKVTMFNFQKENSDVRQIYCNIENGRITQDLQTITDTFYNDSDKTYLFKVKQKWDNLKYYELEDLRFSEEVYRLKLPFSDSNEKLEKGQYIECKIKEFHSEKPYFILTDADPSLMDFLPLDSIFNITDNTDFEPWIYSVLKEEFMSEIYKLYNERHGRWLCLFAKEMGHVIYTLLLSNLINKKKMLSILCNGWITTIEHSSFINNMSEKERSTYNMDFSSSIEVCEDFLDALSALQRNENISNIITSLNPQYYQYRIGRKLRFIACAFAMDREQLKKEMPSLFVIFKSMGERNCCTDDIYMPLVVILKMYTTMIIQDTINVLSVPSTETINIKNGILSLCYLVRILYNRNDGQSCVYVSKIFLLLSLYMAGENEKLTLLKNAYNSLLSDYNPLLRYKWEEFENIVKSQLYLFCQEIPTNPSSELAYNHNNATVKFSEEGLVLAPQYYNGDYTKFIIAKALSVRLSGERSLSHFNEDFLEVQNAWRDVITTIFTPIANKKEKSIRHLQEGDEVEIYVTDIIDERTAKCKVLDYDEIEGTISLKKLLFYEKPELCITDFWGKDGSPLLFLAEYHIENDYITFDADKYKNDFLREEIQINDEILCLVISKNKNGLYVCATYNGFFILVNSRGEDLQRFEYITVTVVQSVKDSIYADFEDFSNETFRPQEAYSRYLKSLNRYEYGDEATWKERKEERTQEDLQIAPKNIASRELLLAMTDVLSRLSILEKDLKIRYGNLCICQILTRIAGDCETEEFCSIRLKYIQLLHSFSLNNKLTESDLLDFQSASENRKDRTEIKERMNVLFILSRLGIWRKRNEPDADLINMLTADCSVLEKELSKLVLSSCLLSKYNNSMLQERILDEIGYLLNINIVKHKVFHIGEENQIQEFKTSIVFPPDNRGNEDIEQQSDNIIRSILSMMNAKGGMLYVGVNDDGNVVGIHNDLVYFSENSLYGESKSRDNFLNHFSCLLADRLGAINAAKFNYYFRDIEDYTIFQVEIPIIHNSNINSIRVGNTIQKINSEKQ